ncbi:MAG TPA: hypothetical protein VNW92_28290 [Polyangiaceae bacterium]|jgi:hypothetical protein|nr:hypothetical protein [Polyangiaceae bacterium]
METTALERAVIGSLLADQEVHSMKSTVDFGAVTVSDRDLTGLGFLTELERCDALKLFADAVSLRWGKVGAKLNRTKVETGYLVYVDGGYVTTVEGYT